MSVQKISTLGILFSINLINFVDRYSIAAVLTKLSKFYSLKAGQSGFLSSSFLVGFMTTAPIFGYLADRYSRKYILIGGVAFWSLMAFAGSQIGPNYYILFFISRMLVGVGEASYSTIAPTIIADLFEPQQRKLALSIFYFAIPVGSGLGFLVGSLALRLGDWRWVCRITPVIGLVATFLLCLLKEPARGQSDGVVSDNMDRDDSSLMDCVKYLLSVRSYVLSTLGFTCCIFAMGALSWWAINFMGVACGENYEQTATVIFGGIVCAAGFIGVAAGSSVAQKIRQYDKRADPLVCAVGVFIAVPFIFFGLLFARSFTLLCWIFLFLSVTALSSNWAVVSDMLLSVTVPNRRAFASAMQIFISHLLGDATSPFIIGFIRSELNYVTDDFKAFLYALLTTLIVLTIGAVTFLFSSRYFVQDVDTCKALMNRQAPSNETRRSDASNMDDFATLP